MNGINNKNNDKAIYKYSRKFHIIFYTSENGDCSNDNKWQQKEDYIQKVNKSGGELIDSKELIISHELIFDII